MRSLLLTVMLCALLAACGGGKQEDTATVNSNTATRTPETANARTPAPSPAQTPAAPDSARPVEFTYLGVAPDKEHIRYKIKVTTDKPVTQVDLGIKYTDDAGKVVDDTTYAWQNIVKSVRKPIENGKTYEVEDEMPEGATKADVVLKRVIFADGTRWSAE